MDRGVITFALALLLCASSGWARGLGVLGLCGGAGQAVESCNSGNILSESFDPTGGDATWSAGDVTGGCTSTLDQTSPSVTGFSGQCYSSSIDTDAYSEAWHTWTDSAGRSVVYIRAYLYIQAEGLADGDSFKVFSYGTSATYPSEMFLELSQSGGSLYLTVIGPSLAGDNVVISASTPYLIEIYALNNGTSDSFEWKINEVSEGTQSGALFDNDFQKINIGVHPDTSKAASLSFYFDKLDISSSGWLGPCE